MKKNKKKKKNKRKQKEIWIQWIILIQAEKPAKQSKANGYGCIKVAIIDKANIQMRARDHNQSKGKSKANSHSRM